MTTNMNDFRTAYAPMQYYGTRQQSAPSEYAADIPRYASGSPFPETGYANKMPFDANSMNYGYGGFNNTDGLSNLLDSNKAFGTAATPGMFGGAKDWWKENSGTLMGTKDSPGLLPTGVGLLTGGMNAYLGMQNYKLAKDSLADSKERYAADYAAQRTTVNNQIGRQAESGAGMGGMSRQEAEAYGRQYAAANGVQEFRRG